MATEGFVNSEGIKLHFIHIHIARENETLAAIVGFLNQG